MRKVVIMATAGALAVGGAVAAGMLGKSADRPDCPGRIICPITGDLICADECPLEAQARDVSLPVAEAEPMRACCASEASPEK